MAKIKSASLQRFKDDSFGILQYATLIEQAHPSKQKALMEQTQKLEPEFYAAVMERVVFFEEFVYLEEATLLEILSNVPPKVLVYGLEGASSEFRGKMLAVLDFRYQGLMREEESKLTRPVAENLIVGARHQVLKLSRQLEAKGKIHFEVPLSPRHGKYE